jgi:hypothetical protein
MIAQHSSKYQQFRQLARMLYQYPASGAEPVRLNAGLD